MSKMILGTIVVALHLVAAATWVNAGEASAEGDPSVAEVKKAVAAATAVSRRQPPSEAQSRDYFTDLPLQTQDGKTVRFYSDVLKDRVVVINFIFTSCEDACPLLTTMLIQVKDALGERFGREVFFVSISIDPDRDTPEALKAFAGRQRADLPGWIWLTGEKTNVDRIVKKLGSYTPEINSHSTLLLAGNVKTRHWAKIKPTSPVPAIAMQLHGFADEL